MQVFRLMNMPDRVIAFDSLPERLLKGFEMCRADGFPRNWKEWMGNKKKLTEIPPEKDFLTGAVRRYDPIVEEAPFFYLVDFTLNPVMEKWVEVCDYVRSHVARETRLMDKIDDMAVPLALDKTSGVTLEPEDVPVIPLIQEVESIITTPVAAKPSAPLPVVKCDEEGCNMEYEGKYAKNAMRLHKGKKHKKEVAAI